jgi:hypothetical protein
MSKLRGLHKLVSELPAGFSVEESTGFLYYQDSNVPESKPEKVGRISIPENPHYSFSIYFEKFRTEKYEKYQKYWQSLNDALAGKKIAGGLVLILAPVPRM